MVTEGIKALLGCRLLRLNQFTHVQRFDTGAMIMHTVYCNPLFLIVFLFIWHFFKMFICEMCYNV
jgi:hypothetical protein